MHSCGNRGSGVKHPTDESTLGKQQRQDLSSESLTAESAQADHSEEIDSCSRCPIDFCDANGAHGLQRGFHTTRLDLPSELWYWKNEESLRKLGWFKYPFCKKKKKDILMYVCASIHECVHRSQNRLWAVQELARVRYREPNSHLLQAVRALNSWAPVPICQRHPL